MGSKYQRLVARGRIAAIPVVAAAAITGGVVGVSSASAKKDGSAAGAAVSKSTLNTLKKYVAAEQAAPAWIAPGPAVNAKKALKGKTIVTFPISSEIDACNLKGQQGYLDAEAKALGANVKPLNTNGGPPAWIANINTAITDKASAVVMLCGPSGAALAPQLAALKSHHIPVVDGNYNQTGGNKAFPFTNISAESGVDTAGGVKTDLADALVNLNGKAAHVLFLNSPQVAQYAGATAALKKAMSQWCSSCSIVKEEDFGTQDWSGPKEIAAVTSDLQANPSINTVIVTFDGMTDGIESAVASAAATHPGLKMYAWGGGLAEIKAVQNGGTFAGDSGPNEKWDAYNQLDQVIRLLAHKPAANVTKEVAPNMFFTKKNAATFSVGGKGQAYSDAPFDKGAFVQDYLRLWGVIK
jgi:ABC-type sugar transport system substrate-binding protein